jgi:maltose O-acetyltransferase
VTVNGPSRVSFAGEVRLAIRRLRLRLIGKVRGWTAPQLLVDRGLRLGSDVQIGDRTLLDPSSPWLITIGDNVTISTGVIVLTHDASMREHVGYTKIAPVQICERVYIGAGSIILPGVTIGADAVVGAGSVVREDVPSGAMVLGNPAQVVSTAERSAKRHEERLAERPTYSITAGALPDQLRKRLGAELVDGPGYIR